MQCIRCKAQIADQVDIRENGESISGDNGILPLNIPGVQAAGAGCFQHFFDILINVRIRI